jgi:hypothetical protein
MIGLLSRISNWKFILPLFVVFALFSFFIFPEYQSRMMEAAGQEIAPLDTRFQYSAADVRRDFDALGQSGREIYKIVVARVDMLFPIVYGLLFVLLLAYLLRKASHDQSRWLLLSLLPLTGVIFDFLENFNILRLLIEHPDFSEETVAYGERMIQLKHVLLFVSVGLMAVLVIAWLIRKVLPPKKRFVKAGKV